MHQRGRDRIVALVCAVLAGLAGPASAWAAAGEGGLISLDKSLIVQWINFIVLLLILTKLLYRPLLAKMAERSQAIRQSLEEAQAARAQAQRQQEENEQRLRQAHAEAAAIREQALREAAEEARRQIEAAQARARKLVDDARAQLEADVRSARAELRREVAELATAVAEKLVRQSLREEQHRRLLAEAITRVGA